MDEIEVRPAAVKTGIDMGKADIDQALCLVDFGGGDDGLHRELHRLALLPAHPGLVLLTQLQCLRHS